MDSIFELENNIKALKQADKYSYNLFNRIFSFYSDVGSLNILPSTKPLFFSYFGQRDKNGELTSNIDDVIENLENQRIVNIFNEWTGQGTLYNSLRSRRPGMNIDLAEKRNKLMQLIRNSKKNCDFCSPEEKTPEDVFGRVRGTHSITAANIAKYDVWSSLVIFKKHNPLEFNQEELSDYLDTSFTWYETVYNEDNDYKFPFFVWNCLPRAGASLVHGHSQILMTKDRSYARVESLNRAIQAYKNDTKGDYLNDLYTVYKALGLSYEIGKVRLFASITPVKEKEIIIISPGSPSKLDQTKNVIYNTLRCFIDDMGVESFNMSISCPGMDEDDKFPYIIRIVDRGDISKSTADMGGMELYGSTVVAEDPYNIIKRLKECF
jgi:galactose-1-phosphate uridylyltransferase